MDADKLHILLNHYPMIGTLIGVPLLMIGLWRKSDQVKRFSLWIFLVVALLTFAVYASGEITGSGAMNVPVIGELVKQHKENAIIAFAVIEATGLAALIGLVLWHRRPQAARLVVLIVLVLSLVSAVIVTRTTLKGRQIKSAMAESNIKIHTEFLRICTINKG